MDKIIEDIRPKYFSSPLITKDDEAVDKATVRLIEAAKAGKDTLDADNDLTACVCAYGEHCFDMGFSVGIRLMTEAAAIFGNITLEEG